MSENPTPTHADLIARGIAKRVNDIQVALPGRVEAYNALTQQAEVQPLLQDAYNDSDNDGERTVIRRPKITSVPVCFPGSGAFRITWPVNPGDTVLLVFSSSSLDTWLAVGGEVDPGDDRHHNISDAMAIPGLFDFAHVPTQAPTNAMVFHASSGLFGGPSSAQSIIRGDAFMSALDTFLSSMITAINGITSASPGSIAAAAITTAKGVFDTAATTYKSSTWKVT